MSGGFCRLALLGGGTGIHFQQKAKRERGVRGRESFCQDDLNSSPESNSPR